MRTKLNGILTLLLALVVQIAFAQTNMISGTVSDDTGSPLPGVNVLIKGTSQGAETDFDGNYSINASVGDILRYSFVGMVPQEKTIGSSSSINVTLETDNVLDEVIILGYGSKLKNEMTGSSVQLSSDKISDIPIVSVDQALQGQVSGLTISGTSGTPGSVQNIRIRGISSITAGNQPLYVIDGVPIVNMDVSPDDGSSTLTSLAFLNSNDVKSITVLKDASATSAYGARGANGVIVITTKTGYLGIPKFNLSTSFGFSNDAIKGRNVLTAQQMINLGYDALVNSGRYSTVAEARANYDWPMVHFGFKEGVDKDPNWGDVILNKNAPHKTYNLSVNGGSEKTTYYASLGFYSSEATVGESNFERLNGAFNFSTKFSETLKFKNNITASNSIQNGLLEGNAFFSSPRTAKYFLNPLAGSPYNEDGTINIDLATSIANPLYITKHNISENRFTRILNNSTLEWKAIDNLTLKTNFSLDYMIVDHKNYQNRVHGDGALVGGIGFQRSMQNTNYLWANTAEYKWNLTDNHKLDFRAIMEYQTNISRLLSAEGEEFSTDGLTNLDTAGKPTGVKASIDNWISMSYLGMVSYKYSNKLFVDLTYRREGSSRFTLGQRFGNFWSTGIAYNISEESFMKSADFIDNLKLRASYGVNGNNNIGLNEYQSLFGFDSNYKALGASYPSQYGNKELSWETNALLDVGLDISLRDNFFTGTFSYYARTTSDLLLKVPLTRTSGHKEQIKNIGEMENSGYEVDFNFNLVRNDDFNFSIGGNFATVKNEVTKMAYDGAGELIEIETATRLTTTGEPVNAWNMRKYAGVNPDNGNAQWYINGKDGDLTEEYSKAKKALQGSSSLPTLTAGLNIHFDYKGFFIDANGYYAGGHQLFEEWGAYTHQGGRFNFTLFQGVQDLTNAWKQPGDITDVPAVRWDYNRDRSQISTRFLYDGDFIRLKNLTIGYDLNSNVLNKTFLTGVRFYVKGTNLATWVKDNRLKQDPEVAADGFIGLTTPPTKTFTFGINLKF